MSTASNDEKKMKEAKDTAYEKAETPELRAFLQYVQDNKADSEFTRRISDMVEVKKEQQGFLSAYYVYKMHEDTIRNAGKREGFAEGIEQGRTEGAEQNKLDNARNLLAMKVLANEQIAQAVGLPLETIEELSSQE